MWIDGVASCCGIGELYGFEEYLDEFEDYTFDDLLDKVVAFRDGRRGDFIKYPVIIATTPNTTEWIPIHWILTLADFIPVAEGKSMQGNYSNILWVFQRKGK